MTAIINFPLNPIDNISKNGGIRKDSDSDYRRHNHGITTRPRNKSKSSDHSVEHSFTTSVTTTHSEGLKHTTNNCNNKNTLKTSSVGVNTEPTYDSADYLHNTNRRTRTIINDSQETYSTTDHNSTKTLPASSKTIDTCDCSTYTEHDIPSMVSCAINDIDHRSSATGVIDENKTFKRDNDNVNKQRRQTWNWFESVARTTSGSLRLMRQKRQNYDLRSPTEETQEKFTFNNNVFNGVHNQAFVNGEELQSGLQTSIGSDNNATEPDKA